MTGLLQTPATAEWPVRSLSCASSGKYRVELQVFANPSVHHARGRESAKPSQAARAATGGVSEFRVKRRGSLQHDVGDDARLIGACHYLFYPLAHRRTNLPILVELRVCLQKVRVELRLRVRRLDDRHADAPRA